MSAHELTGTVTLLWHLRSMSVAGHIYGYSMVKKLQPFD